MQINDVIFSLDCPQSTDLQFYLQSVSHCCNLVRAHGSSAAMKISTGEWKKVGYKQNKMSKTRKLSSSIWCPAATLWRLIFLADTGLFQCFHNPSNSDMYDKIFNMLMWCCMHILRETKFYSLIQKTYVVCQCRIWLQRNVRAGTEPSACHAVTVLGHAQLLAFWSEHSQSVLPTVLSQNEKGFLLPQFIF